LVELKRNLKVALFFGADDLLRRITRRDVCPEVCEI